MKIRAARQDDLPRILGVFETARAFMRAQGNPGQWPVGYPDPADLRREIARGEFFVFADAGDVPRGCFALIEGDDPTYQEIQGAWLQDGPYATIHRIATDGSFHGALAAAVAFGERRRPWLRIDTHEDNRPMRGAVAKEGFVACGTIFLPDGSPRLAFERPPRPER